SAEGRKAERPVVDVLTVRRDDRVDGVRVWAPQYRDRARRRRGAGAFRAVGEELGVALVQPGDGVAKPLGREYLDPPATALLVGEQSGERVEVSGDDGGVQAGDVRGRGVRALAAPVPLRNSGWCGRVSRRWPGRQLIEAGERFVLTIAVEELDARQAIDS